MYGIETGLFPTAGLMAAALLYVAYYTLVRLRCTAGWAQIFIAISVVLTTVLTLVSPVKIVETQAEADFPMDEVAPTLPMLFSEAPAETVPIVRTTEEIAVETAPVSMPEAKPSYEVLLQDTSSILGWLYVAGIVAVLLYFGAQFLWYARERRVNPLVSSSSEARIYDTNYLQPFSFGRSIFLPASLGDETRRYALVHELCHVRHRHFLKLCLFELLLAVNWFNPFLWLFFNEMKLQQELETDADVLSTGINRRRYQMSLLKTAVQGSRWLIVQSSFGTKPIKQRIIFMNKSFNIPSMRRRLVAAAATIVLTLSVILSAGCQANKQEAPATDSGVHHDLYGVWTLEFTRPAGSQQEIYPPFKQSGFYADDVFFTPHFSFRDGNNMRFGYSGSALEVKDGQLIDANGQPMVYRFVSDNTFQTDWKKGEGDVCMVNAETVTDQWSRITPDSTIMNLFHAACKAEQAHAKPLDGVWYVTDEKWMFFNDSIMLALNFHQDSTVCKFGGSGHFFPVLYGEGNTLTFSSDTYHWEQRDESTFALINADTPEQVTLLERRPLPQIIRRILNATLIENP